MNSSQRIPYELSQAKHWEEMRLVLNQAISLDPAYAVAYYNRGIAYAEVEQYEQAIADYTQAIRLDPSNPTLFFLRGLAYHHLEQYEAAFTDYTQTLTPAPAYGPAYYHRGLVSLWLQRVTQAVKDFQRSYELDPTNLAAAERGLWAALSKVRPAASLAAQLQAVAEIAPKQYAALVCQSIALGLQGKLRQGLALLDQAISLEAEEYDAYFWKGMLFAYYAPGQPERAKEWIQKALEKKLPPILLTPLYWLRADHPAVFEHLRGLLEQYLGDEPPDEEDGR